MVRHAMSFLLASVLALTCVTPVAALEYTIWHSPRTLESRGPIITIIPGLHAAASELTFNGVGQEWVQMPLTVPSNVTVTGVVLCYEVSNAASYISQIRITTLDTPDSDSITLDDPTDRTSTAPECVTSAVIISSHKTLTLQLRIVAASGLDVIKIGGIGIVVDDGAGSAPEPFTTGE